MARKAVAARSVPASAQAPTSTPSGSPSKQRVSRRAALLSAAGLVGVLGAGALTTRLLDDDDQPAGRGAVTPLPPGPTTSATTQPTRPGDQGLPALPARVVSMWVNAFESPTIRQIPTDVLQQVTLMVLAMAQSGGSGSGRLKWSHPAQSQQAMRADIADVVDRRIPVLLGIGGASDGGITVRDDQQVEDFVASVHAMVRTYGFPGVDIDLEPSGSSWTEAALVAAVRQLKRDFGATFLVGLTVGLYAEYEQLWFSLARALGDDLDYWAPMLYDFPEAHDDRLIQVALDKVGDSVAAGVPAHKQVLGFMCNSYYNTSPVDVAANAWRAAKQAHPDLRGAFIWESKLEAEHGYPWTRTVGPLI